MSDRPPCTTPVLFAIFNRPSTTRVVFDEIRKARPKKLFLVADGPREGKIGEKEKCAEVRKIVENVDWDCEVHRNYSDVNLGNTKRGISGMTWFFEHVEAGIILEDDGLPHPDFFPYCTEMLERYRNNSEIMMVGANNFQGGKKWGEGSYFFSAFPLVWGFAMWKRTWDLYDVTLDTVSESDIEASLSYYFRYKPQRYYWWKFFQRVKADKNPAAWDAQFLFGLWKRRALSIVPNVNLVSNIGFGEGATHTQDVDSNCASVLMSGILPIVHPKKIEICREADIRFYKLCVLTLPKKIVRKISRVVHADDPWLVIKNSISSLL